MDFTYPGTDRQVLHDVNFTLRQGETLAVVGINGAGKSTLVKLLLRFYDPTGGQILYNGKPLPEYDLEQLRAAFGTVFQDYKNFALSVNENVIGHTCTPAEKALAEQALRHSGVWDKIASLPRGADTVLTREFDEAGTGLSGGENQKVSTARLFARDFQIAVLDEPSSALDPVAEYKMYENLLQVTENKTVIFISAPAVQRGAQRPHFGAGRRSDAGERLPPAADGAKRPVCGYVPPASLRLQAGRGCRRCASLSMRKSTPCSPIYSTFCGCCLQPPRRW